MGGVLSGVLIIVVGLAAIVGLGEIGYRMTAHYAPRYEQVRRETFEQSRAFQEGAIRDLENLQLDYVGANAAGKAAIRAAALHRLADVDPTILPPALRDFAAQLRSDTP